MDMPYANESFDKVICMWSVFNHLLTSKDQVKALNEMYRVLSQDGLAFIEMGNGEGQKYRHTMATSGYGHKKRVFDLQLKEGPPPNVLYLHNRGTLTSLAKKSRFVKFHVKFQNINHKRRIVTYLLK